MPKALSVLWGLIKDKTLGSKEKYQLIKEFDEVFGLGLNKIKNEEIPEDIIKLAEKREKCRKEKDFKNSDKIREEINKKGYLIEDAEDGYKIRRLAK